MAKKGKLTTGPSKKAYYKAYPAKYESHRIRDLERHIKNNPEDLQAIARLESAKDFKYRRDAKGRSHDQPKVTRERENLVSEQLRRYLSSIPRKIPEYVELLREFSRSLKPKVRYKRGKRI